VQEDQPNAGHTRTGIGDKKGRTPLQAENRILRETKPERRRQNNKNQPSKRPHCMTSVAILPLNKLEWARCRNNVNGWERMGKGGRKRQKRKQ